MENLNKYVEHTLLKQDARKADLIKLFEEAKEYKFLGVCINPCYVKLERHRCKSCYGYWFSFRSKHYRNQDF